MFIVFLIAFSLVYTFLFKKRTIKSMLNATPAYAPKRRLPKNKKIQVPEYIPKFYY